MLEVSNLKVYKVNKINNKRMEDKILKKHWIHFIVVVNMNNRSEKCIKYKFYKCYVKYDRIYTLFYRDKQTGKKVF